MDLNSIKNIDGEQTLKKKVWFKKWMRWAYYSDFEFAHFSVLFINETELIYGSDNPNRFWGSW